MNPVYTWFVKYEDQLSYYRYHNWYNMIEDLAQMIEDYSEIRIPTIRRCKVRHCINHYPIVHLRTHVVSCLISNSTFYDMIAYSNRHVFDIGTGSGYNAMVLKKMGCKTVYAIDTLKCRDWEVELYPIDYTNYDDDTISKIAVNNGAALYVWPWRRYYHLKRWLRNGGRRIITIGCINVRDYYFQREYPDVPEEEVPFVCPPFPPKEYKDNFIKVSEDVMESFNMKDTSMISTIQFWIYNS